MYRLTKILNNKLALVAIFTLVFGLVVAPGLSFAVGTSCSTDVDCAAEEYCNDSGVCAVVDNGSSDSSKDDPFGITTYEDSTYLGDKPLTETISSIINVALGLLGTVALVIVLAGGFKWMTAGGNEEKTTEARKLIFAGIIGLAIILSAYAISSFVLKQLYSATKGTEYPGTSV